MAGRTTHDNPGARQARKVRPVRAIVAEVLRATRAREYRRAAVNAMADTINLVETFAGPHLRPRFRCTCCGHESHALHHVVARNRVAWNSACPSCDSRSRHRGLAILLPRLVHPGARVIHFAPEPVLRDVLARDGVTYHTADLFLEDVTFPRTDLAQLPFLNESYDVVVCNHVLEHLPEDRAALSHFARILTRDGVAVITVPGDFTRADTLHFTGELENGHYRDYGLDFVDRLREHFGQVDVIDLHSFDRDQDGMSRAIRMNDLAFVCRLTESKAQH